MNKHLLAALLGLWGLQAQAADPWYEQGQAALQQALQQAPNQQRAKNVILFVGDGMGISTLTATRIYEGQLRGQTGEENQLAWEALPYVALSKTYNTNLQTPDSAGTMSAMMTGVKTSGGVISVNQQARYGHCASSKGNEVQTLLEQAERLGMATGVVSTARITHATPAATYAHSPMRGWEADSDLSDEARSAGCRDIARQLVEFSEGDGIDVVLGGGRRNFLPDSQPDPEHPDKTGVRKDGRNLLQQWQDTTGGQFVWDNQGLQKARAHQDKKLLGLFSPSHMAYEADRLKEKYVEPSLAQMTEVAIERLAGSPEGFFMMVEGGRIDHAHHAGNAARALQDGVALHQAVARALALVDLRETLVIVTADHSHVFSMAGYPVRGNPILGLVKSPGVDGVKLALAADGKPYTTLGYLNGPGFGEAVDAAARENQAPKPGRHLHDKVNTQADNYYQEALIPLESETHGGEDVAIFAGGPWAHLFQRTHEQHYIYHVMRHALGMEERLKAD